MFIDSSYLTGCYLLTFSVSKGLGNFDNINYILFSTISSGLSPDPEDSLGKRLNTLSLFFYKYKLY